jgi:hypothetical protein
MPRFKLAILRAVFRIPCTTNLRNHCSVRRISGNPRGRGASRDCGAAAQKRIQRRCRKAMHAEHADASVRLQDRRSRIRYRPTRVAGVGSQVEPRRCPHRRVLRGSPTASALKFLLCGAAGRCWRTHWQSQHTLSGATPWHCACMVPRFGCGQRLRCVAPVISEVGANSHAASVSRHHRW